MKSDWQYTDPSFQMDHISQFRAFSRKLHNLKQTLGLINSCRHWAYLFISPIFFFHFYSLFLSFPSSLASRLGLNPQCHPSAELFLAPEPHFAKYPSQSTPQIQVILFKFSQKPDFWTNFCSNNIPRAPNPTERRY